MSDEFIPIMELAETSGLHIGTLRARIKYRNIPKFPHPLRRNTKMVRREDIPRILANDRRNPNGNRKGIYTLAELSERTGAPERTIRYWIQKQIIPRALCQGGTDMRPYDESHVRAIELITAVKKQRITLADLRTLANRPT